MDMPQDQKLFREMSEPHESREALQAAHHQFFEEVVELRKKHKIANILQIYADSYESDGEEAEMLGASMIGDQTRAESMCAFAYGSFKRQREEMLAKLLSGKQ
jgi:hypothetical protein